MPAFDSKIIGRRFEVCWPYKKDGQTVKVWASGACRAIADGKTTKRSKACKALFPAGALLWAWDADPEFDECAGEQWLVLHPHKWNRHVQYAWRFDPCEIAVGGGKLVELGDARPRGKPREPLVDDCVTDDEFYE